MPKKISRKLLKEIFDTCSILFLKKEKENILSGVSERNWYSFWVKTLDKLLEENNIHGYLAEAEYNRNQGKIKTILDDNYQVVDITCDVIVHSRGQIPWQDNLICMEMKKSTASLAAKEKDRQRVKILTKDSYDDVWSFDGKSLPVHVCRYVLGIYYEINLKDKLVYIEYYAHGKLLSKNKYYF